MTDDKTKKAEKPYVDPNSGAAPQPGGAYHRPYDPETDGDKEVAEKTTDSEETPEEQDDNALGRQTTESQAVSDKSVETQATELPQGSVEQGEGGEPDDTAEKLAEQRKSEEESKKDEPKDEPKQETKGEDKPKGRSRKS